MREYIGLFLKGMGIGAANVIPGVSGGTIALITGIFEKLIDSLKSFNLHALKLLLTGKFKDFASYINLYFLIAVFAGVFVSILSFARLLEFLFGNYPVYVWAYFFGLIIASVYFVGKTIPKISLPVVISFVIGTTVALLISFLSPASRDESTFYLFLCGIVAVCSMILPGLSGSFVLILMGNYELIFIEAVNELNLAVLLPVGVGAIFGLLAFSHALSWIFKRYRESTLAVLTGFILGSLGMLWPWKNEIYRTNSLGELITKADGAKIIEGYERYLPDSFNQEVYFAILLMIIGFFTIAVMERIAAKKSIRQE
jgi:putative membrane protein